ncbi:hypothetical protein BB559_002683 [Furculomyces boomerangus]|uniref:Complex 1 LYR protein domain-containing protein n=1 Tax=Furculomyces boomerangus TaxID=61424 RepID=A0A2T9YTH3_9FUNG|nr:hypothetical protein BB559_002683 [Furculomyces boomerangus]
MRGKFSGLQKDVLKLYRDFVRAARNKPIESRKEMIGHVREKFAANISMDKKEYDAIAFYLRSGRRKLEMFKKDSVKHISKSSADLKYEIH